MKKLIFVLGLGIGFVVGSRAGRAPYEQLERAARNVAEDPTVREKAADARDAAGKVAQGATEAARTKGPEVAAGVKGKVADGAAGVKDKVSRSGDDEDLPTGDVDGVAGGDAQVGDKPLGS